MLVSPAALADTARIVEPATDDGSSTEVLITPQQVLLSTAAAAGVRQGAGARLIAAVKHMFAASEPPRPRSQHYVKRYGYLENAAMARAMERL